MSLGKVPCMVIGSFDISLLWYVLTTTGKLLVLFVFVNDSKHGHSFPVSLLYHNTGCLLPCFMSLIHAIIALNVKLNLTWDYICCPHALAATG